MSLMPLALSIALAYQQASYLFQVRQHDYVVQTKLRPDRRIETDFVVLEVDGRLWIKFGYASDGPTGLPAWAKRYFKRLLRGAFGHDAIYQLIRSGLLPESARAEADQYLLEQWLEDGVWSLLAHTGVAIVRQVGDRYAKAGTEPKTLVAP